MHPCPVFHPFTETSHFSLRPIAWLCAGGGLAQLTNPSHAPRSGKWFLPWLADKHSLRSSCIPAPPFKSRPGKNSNRREARSRLNCFLCRRRDLNPHPLRDTILSRARLPLRHSGIRQQPHSHETSNLTNCESALPGSIITPFWQCTDSTAFVDWILDLS